MTTRHCLLKTTAATTVLLLASCTATRTNADAPSPAREPTEAQAPATADEPAAPCGASTKDWCPSPEGDPCGEHSDEESCRADPQCVGVQYRGESFVACQPDGHGFWTNCPAVGCVSKPRS
ncbi:MAG TPA: hypothetical protein VFL14_01890 [Xanthomonadales bacterium]|nr:hypothetical protein [Xanthomonadales bacterium]